MAAIIKSVPVAVEAYLMDAQGRLVAPNAPDPVTVGEPAFEREAKSQATPTVHIPAPVQDLDALIAERVEQALAERLQQVRAAWLEEAESARSAAAEQGYRAGLLEAEKETAARHEAVLRSVQSFADTLSEQVSDRLADVEELAGRIAWEALIKIIGDAAASRDLILGVVAKQLRELGAQGAVVLSVHPDDMEVVAEGFPSSETLAIRLKADASVARGGCIVETARGILDARMETQLEALLSALQGKAVKHPEALES